ncbi:SWIRM-domain-containing protein, partial [Fistulina hepatica ATCC 64428]
VNEPGLQLECDACGCDLTHNIRIRCADPACVSDEPVDICPPCFLAGKEFANHKRNHPYRVIEFNSYPIFSEDWGADEELLLLKGIQTHGLGNWKKIAEHVGTRTKEDVEEHYLSVYINSPDFPLPVDTDFYVNREQFQERKRRRLAKMDAVPPPGAKVAPTSAPGVHEVSTFLPGRLEFEHEMDNDAEALVKDLEFGVCYQYGGDELVEDEMDQDTRARKKWKDDKAAPLENGCTNMTFLGSANGVHVNGTHVKAGSSGTNEIDEAEELPHPLPTETSESLAFKFTLLDMYFHRVGKRDEAKSVMFDRGLLEYKKMQAADKKRPKEERDILHRLRPFARLQTAEDYEEFAADILYEAMLRKQITDFQKYRRNGLTEPSEIERFEHEEIKHVGLSPEAGPTQRRPVPLDLSNSPSLHLLTPAEAALCSQLRILPKPYLVIKETLVREYARRGGKLRRREARELVKIDVNKTSRVWDFLVQAGYLKLSSE